jgi:hypothetical protein
VLLGRRGRGEEQARARDTAATRWRPGGARVGVAHAREGQGGEARAVAGVQATRGVARSWRWRWATAEARHMAREAAVSDMKRGGVPKDWFAKTEKFRDLTIN